MNLTSEQLEQCRKEYLLKFKLAIETDNARWIGFQAAWRPIPSVGEIAECISENNTMHILPMAQAIHRAFGGKDE